MRWILADAEYEGALRDWSVDAAAEQSFHVRHQPYGRRITKLQQLIESFDELATKPLNFLGGKEIGEGPYDITTLTYAADDGSYMHLTAQRLASPLQLSAITVEAQAKVEEFGGGTQLVVTGARHLNGVLVRADGEAIISSAYGKVARPTAEQAYEHVLPPLSARQLRGLLLYLAEQDLRSLHDARQDDSNQFDHGTDW